MTGVVGPDEGMGYSGSAKAKAIYHEARNCIRKSSVRTPERRFSAWNGFASSFSVQATRGG
jgi:hypothetical protein